MELENYAFSTCIWLLIVANLYQKLQQAFELEKDFQKIIRNPFSIDIHCRQHVDEKVKTSKRGDLSFDCRDPPQRTAWTRQPTVAFSQVGNHQYKELFLTLAFWGGLIFVVDFWRWIFHLLPQALDVCCYNLCAEEQVEAFWPRKPRKPKTRKPQTRPHSGVPIINVPTN